MSHSSVDNAQAVAIRDWLAEVGWDDCFFDVKAEEGLAPGERWREALKKAANRCQVVVCLISPAWQASDWCKVEMLLARQLGKAVIGVLVAPMAITDVWEELSAERQLCDLMQSGPRREFRVTLPHTNAQATVQFSEEGLRRLRIGLERCGLDPARFPWPPRSDLGRWPYRGLSPMEPEDAAVFFGRDASIVRGLGMIRGMRELGQHSVLVILAASGAGKSSFLRAGLWPRLRRDDQHYLPLTVVRPGAAAISGESGLAASLEREFEDGRAPKSKGEIKQLLRTPGGFAALLAELAAKAADRQGNGAQWPTVLISIDQGEELVASDGGGEANELLALLGEVLYAPQTGLTTSGQRRPQVLALVAIRADGYARLQKALPTISDAAPAVFDLPPMGKHGFNAVIEGPAMLHQTRDGTQLKVDPALTDELCKEMQGVDPLPLLAFTLERLFADFRSSPGGLKFEHLEAIGGVAGSIEKALDAAFADPGRHPSVPEDKTERLAILRLAFLPWLAGIDRESGQPKRRIAAWGDFRVEAHPLLTRMVEARLLTKSVPAGAGEHDATVEVAHEALLRHWSNLVDWLREASERLLLVDETKAAANRWDVQRHQDRGELAGDWLAHRGGRLRLVMEACGREEFQTYIEDTDRAYLDACRKQESKEKEVRRLALVGLAALVILVSTYATWSARRSAETQQAFYLASTANGLAPKPILDALVMASIASVLEPGATSTRGALFTALARRPPSLKSIWRNAHGALHALVTQRLSDVIASASADGTITLWRNGQEVSQKVHNGAALSLSFSPDGRTLASGGEDGKVVLLAVKDGRFGAVEEIKFEEATNRSVQAIAFDPLQTVFAVGRGNLLQLIDLKTRTVVQTISVESPITSLDFDASGTRLVAGAWDTKVRIYKRQTDAGAQWNLQGTFGTETPSVPVWRALFRHDSREMAVALNNGRVVLYKLDGDTVTEGAILREPAGQQLFSLNYLRDGGLVAGTSNHEVVRWLVKATEASAGADRINGLPLLGHDKEIRALAVSADGRTLYSGDDDGAIFVWDAEPPKGLESYAENALSVAFSPDGAVLAIGTNGPERKGVEFYDVKSGQRSADPRYRGFGVSASPRRVLFNATGDTMAVGTDGAYAQLWNRGATGPVELPDRQLGVAKTYTWAIAFHSGAHGEEVVTGSYSDATPEIRFRNKLGADLVQPPLLGRSRMLTMAVNGDHLLEGGADGGVRLWDAAKRSFDCEVGRHNEGAVRAVAFGRQVGGRIMASASEDQSVRIWRRCNDDKPKVLKSNSGQALSLAFDSTGSMLVAGTQGGHVLFWDVASGEQLADVEAHGSEVHGMTISPDGKWIATAAQLSSNSNPGSHPIPTVRLWDTRTDTASLRQRACDLLNGRVLESEWDKVASKLNIWRSLIPGSTGYKDICR